MWFGGCRQHSEPCQLLNDIFNGASEGLPDFQKINVCTTAEPWAGQAIHPSIHSSINYLVSTELNTFLVHPTLGVQQIFECIVQNVTWF